MSDKTTRLEILCQRIQATYGRKNKDYGDSFGKTFQKYGIISALTRMSDKWNRIETLATGKKNLVSDDSLEDTLMDMACYCLMTVIEIEDAKKDGRWFDHD